MRKTGATPGKLALAGALALAFIYVLRSPHAPEEPAQPESAPKSMVAAPAAMSPTTSDGGLTSIDQILRHDPFAPIVAKVGESADAEQVPTADEPTAAEAQVEPVEGTIPAPATDAPRVRLVYRGGRASAALIDSRVVREGDRLGGATVVEIRDDGIVLQASEPEDAPSLADGPLEPTR